MRTLRARTRGATAARPWTAHPGDLRRGLSGPGSVLILFLAACGSASRGAEELRPATPPSLPAATVVSNGPSAPSTNGLVEAVGTDELDRAYHLVLETLERCGTRPLGQQALLLLVTAELDPRNPDPRLSLALQATRIALAATPSEAWSRPLLESLHLVALRLGAEEPPPEAADESELRWRAERGNAELRLAAEACAALPWPAGLGAGDPGVFEIEGGSYPAQIRRLKHRLAELEAEVQRLRRISKAP